MEEKTYSVYMHVSPSKKVYIGITKRKPKYRWNNGRAYSNNIYFTNAIKKYGWDNFQHIILYSNISENEAKEKEIELIAKYNATNPQYGYNITLGGESGNGYKPTEDVKRRISQAEKGRSSPMKGRKHTDKAKEKISYSLRHTTKPRKKGFHLSEETKRKIGLSQKGKPKPKPANFSKVMSELKKGTKASDATKAKLRESRLRWSKNYYDTILQVNKQGIITNKWNNQSEAYRALGFIQSTFQLHVSNGKPLKGYYYIKEKDYNEIFNNKFEQLELW